MADGRDQHGCAVVTTNAGARAVVVAGGCDDGDCEVPLSSVERLVMTGDDYTAWYWETLPSLPQGRYGPTLSPTLDNTGVRIIGGGYRDTATLQIIYPSDVLELAPADNSSSWTKVENVSYSGGWYTVAPILAC